MELWWNKSKKDPWTREELADLIEKFLDGTGGQWDWDDFTSIKLRDPDLERIRERCVAIANDYPSNKRTEYCSPQGLKVLRSIVAELRKGAP